MKFIHAADIHIGSPTRGLANYENTPIAEVRGATRRAFESLTRLAMEERVDSIPVAGDVHDGFWRDANTDLFIDRRVTKLDRVGVPGFLVRGIKLPKAASRGTLQVQRTAFSSRRRSPIRAHSRKLTAVHDRG